MRLPREREREGEQGQLKWIFVLKFGIVIAIISVGTWLILNRYEITIGIHVKNHNKKLYF